MTRVTSAVLGLGLLVSGAAMGACPNLAGEYRCINERETHSLKIEQREIDNGMAYKMTGPGVSGTGESVWDVLADGKEHDFPADQGVKDGKYNASCVNLRTVNVVASGKATDDRGQPVGDIEMSMIFDRESRDMTVMTKGHVVTPGQTYEIDSTMNCVLE